ncbi:MAG: PepSY domain-containing protein [Alphaproteobacteria bacterium]|jgi:uncharacterized membrane protein YkoI|nr:PepSY domain-containing protein [Alphaproteobacteria bacterium]MDP6517934.1 PepSY domain-containing protein [Alphaproteobacteria bacterium]|tara:strand:+ start:752 stop:1297 length:546 start_codon:yes stop_codon:yes gene_type:complete
MRNLCRWPISAGAALAAVLASQAAVAVDLGEYADEDDKTLETCLQVALDVFGGEALNVEYKFEEGDPIYDFDILAPDGTRWEVEVNAENGMIWEIEREVAKTDPMFTRMVRIDEKDALVTALEMFPGTVESVEYGIETDGSAVYEFDINLPGGGEMNVEVDAATGRITEANPELWEIGEGE